MLARDTLGQADGGGGFEQRERRTAEQPGLLAGDDRHRSGLRESSRGRDRFWRGAAARPAVRGRSRRSRDGACDVRARPRSPRATTPARPDFPRRRRRRARSRTRSPPPAAASMAGAGRPPRTARRSRMTRQAASARGTYSGKAFAGLSRTVDRYAAPCANLVLGVNRIAVPGARSAPRDTPNQPGASPGYRRQRALGWLDAAARHATIHGASRGVPPLSIDGSSPGSPPAAFGPFRVLHQVGAGTTGFVFRAHDPVEGRLVAIKAFRLDLTPERAAELAGALQELVARSVSHPSIAAPIAAGVEDGIAWFAQAYVPAESLDSALRQYGPPPVADALTIVTQLAGALDFAAAAGVVHGALHPRDVLVAPGETHLVDLGVAAALESIRRTCAGSPAVQRAGARRGPAPFAREATSSRSVPSRSSCSRGSRSPAPVTRRSSRSPTSKAPTATRCSRRSPSPLRSRPTSATRAGWPLPRRSRRRWATRCCARPSPASGGRRDRRRGCCRSTSRTRTAADGRVRRIPAVGPASSAQHAHRDGRRRDRPRRDGAAAGSASALGAARERPTRACSGPAEPEPPAPAVEPIRDIDALAPTPPPVEMRYAAVRQRCRRLAARCGRAEPTGRADPAVEPARGAGSGNAGADRRSRRARPAGRRRPFLPAVPEPEAPGSTVNRHDAYEPTAIDDTGPTGAPGASAHAVARRSQRCSFVGLVGGLRRRMARLRRSRRGDQSSRRRAGTHGERPHAPA